VLLCNAQQEGAKAMEPLKSRVVYWLKDGGADNFLVPALDEDILNPKLQPPPQRCASMRSKRPPSMRGKWLRRNTTIHQDWPEFDRDGARAKIAIRECPATI
jgi:hypothetical protein